MNTPTPRTDAATYPADCLGQTLVTNRDCPCALERELTALTTERDQLRAEVERLKTCGITELAAVNSSVLEYCKHWEARADRAEADLATERARLDWLLLDVVSRFDDAYYTRAAIDAAMKEETK